MVLRSKWAAEQNAYFTSIALRIPIWFESDSSLLLSLPPRAAFFPVARLTPSHLIGCGPALMRTRHPDAEIEAEEN